MVQLPNALGKDDRLVTPHAAFLALGLDVFAQRSAYAELVDQRLDPSLVEDIHAATKGGYPMGSDPKKKTRV